MYFVLFILVKVNYRNTKGLQNVKNLVNIIRVPSVASPPHESLQKGNWVKLICGASFEVLKIKAFTQIINLIPLLMIEQFANQTKYFILSARMWLTSGIFL